jgi:hypothetical protein
VPVTRELEDMEIKRTSVWELTQAGAKGPSPASLRSGKDATKV